MREGVGTTTPAYEVGGAGLGVTEVQTRLELGPPRKTGMEPRGGVRRGLWGEIG